jgi:carbonic anhydrase
MPINRLLNGYRQFYRQHFVEDRSQYRELREGQHPNTLVIACSDSRVSPAIVTQALPGEIFEIRNVANLVPPYQPDSRSLHGVSAALEFAVCHLKVSHVIVMGHSGCGGIRALREGVAAPEGEEFSFIQPWVNIVSDARSRALRDAPGDPEAQQTCCEQEAIKTSLKNLMSFPWIAKRVEQGDLKLHGWYFRIKDGKLLTYHSEAGIFEPQATAALDA